MPGKDLTRWQQEDDGSWTRLNQHLDEPDENDDDDDDPKATKGAREAATELGIDLAAVTGSGLNDRITKQDVEAAHAAQTTEEAL